MPLMAVLGRRVGGRWTGLGAALGAAFLPFLLGEAQETRMYTVTLVWLACAGWALLRTEEGTRDQGRIRGQGRDRELMSGTVYWLLFALFSALALLDPLCRGLRPGGSVGLGSDVGAAELAASARWKRLRTVLLAGLLTALAVPARAAGGVAADPLVSQPEPGRPARRRLPGRVGAGLWPRRAPGCRCRAAVGLGPGRLAGDRVGAAAASGVATRRHRRIGAIAR